MDMISFWLPSTKFSRPQSRAPTVLPLVYVVPDVEAGLFPSPPEKLLLYHKRTLLSREANGF